MEIEEKIARIEELRENLSKGGGRSAIEKHHAKSKLTARERIEKLLDQGTFLELESFSKPIDTNIEIGQRSIRGDGVLSGYGEISGRPVCVWADDATVVNGKAGIIHLRKMVTILERALKSRVPCIGIIDSEGIRYEDMLSTPTNYRYDRLIYVQALASGIIPLVSLIMGPCVGAAAVSAQLSDFVFMVKNTSYVSIIEKHNNKQGDLRQRAILYARESGSCDVLAENEEDCILKVRELLSLLPTNRKEKAPLVDSGDDPNREVTELLELVPVDSRKAFDMHKAITVIADNGLLFEIKAEWAKNLIIGFSLLGGRTVGIIANNPKVKAGCMDVDASDKMARFVRFCDAFCIPLVYLADTPAFLPSIDQERQGIIRHGAKVVFSNSIATVPQVQVYIRKCYGGGNLAMPGNALGGDFGITWPTTELLLMHPEGAVSILYRKEIAGAENPKEEYCKRLDHFKASDATEKIWEYMTTQDCINPKHTRCKLIQILRKLEDKVMEIPWRNNDNMPL